MLDKSIREIERERQGLQNQEKKLIAEIKKTAKQGQMVNYLFPTSIFSFFSFLLTFYDACVIIFVLEVVCIGVKCLSARHISFKAITRKEISVFLAYMRLLFH